MKTYPICYYPIKENPPRRGSRYFGVVLLKPKRNILSEKQYQKLISHEGYEECVKQGIVQDLTEKPPTPPKKPTSPPKKASSETENETVEDITKATIANALKAIKAETDPIQLQIWMTQEHSNPRKNVLKALEKATKAYPAKKEEIKGEQTSLFEVLQ